MLSLALPLLGLASKAVVVKGHSLPSNGVGSIIYAVPRLSVRPIVTKSVPVYP